MNSSGFRAAIILALSGATPFALACSACIKDILSEVEFDRRSWAESSDIFVGLVVASQLVEGLDEIEYDLRVEETIKGSSRAVTRVFSSRVIDDWRSELEEISCGGVSISVGDRLLVFSGRGGTAQIGTCSSSRVIEGAMAPSRAEVKETLDRLRQWAG